MLVSFTIKHKQLLCELDPSLRTVLRVYEDRFIDSFRGMEYRNKRFASCFVRNAVWEAIRLEQFPCVADS